VAERVWSVDAVERERWFGDKGRSLRELRVIDELRLGKAGSLAVAEARFADGGWRRYTLVDGAGGDLWAQVASLVASAARVQGSSGVFVASAGPAWDGANGFAAAEPLGADQSHTSVVVGGRVLLKLYRRLEPGPGAEVELVEHLTRAGFAHVPAYRGSLAWHEDGGPEWPLALLQDYVPGSVDGYAWGAEALRPVLVAGAPGEEAVGTLADLGAITASLHRALAPLGGRAADASDLAAWHGTAAAKLDEALAVLGGDVQAEVAARAPRIRDELAALTRVPPPPLQRVHGDYHLGQVLRHARAWAIVDFEGEPTSPPAQRRLPESALRDVASMLRSLDHAVAWRLAEEGPSRARLARARHWLAAARAAFLGAYEAVAPAPVNAELLRAFEVEKELYEFTYAQRFLPEWLFASLAGLRWLLDGELSLGGPAGTG
jgi:maltokinase